MKYLISTYHSIRKKLQNIQTISKFQIFGNFCNLKKNQNLKT